jgi:hypothetical protein
MADPMEKVELSRFRGQVNTEVFILFPHAG